MNDPIRFSFATPISAAFLTLADGKPGWVQILATGSWKHPSYGDMKITGADLRELKENFDRRVRDFVYADYDHGMARPNGSGNAIAAGEVKALDVRNNDSELWALYEPTAPARAKITAREYRFTSADFIPRYNDKKTGKSVGKVLRGFALTNTPFIEGMHPLALGDANAGIEGAAQLFAEYSTTTIPSRESYMPIAKKLGLKADASDSEIETAVDTLLADARRATTLSESHTAATRTIGDVRSALNLAETTPEKDVVAAVKTLSEQNTTLTKTAREAAADSLITTALREGRMVPAQKDTYREQLLSETPAVAESAKKLLAAAPKIHNAGKPAAEGGDDASKDYDTLLDETIVRIKKDDTKVTFSDALVLAERELDKKGITKATNPKGE